MSIRWDPLLVRHLARELNETLHGARLRAIRLDARTRDLVLFFRDRTLVWKLHPNRCLPLMRDAVEPQAGDHRMKARVRAVRSLPDERVVVFELTGERAGHGPWELVVELLGNQLNAIVAEGSDRTIRHVLRTREGRRTVKVGQRYEGPESTLRLGLSTPLTAEAWHDLIDPVPPPDRARELMRRVAWVSPVNVDAFLDGGFDEWSRATDPERATEPVVLTTERGLQPYPFPLPGVEASPAESLMAALESCAEIDAGEDDGTAALTIGPELLERLADAVTQAERRVVRLTAELDGREDPAAVRALGDLLLARYGEIPAGREIVTVSDFEGNPVELTLDPALPPHENASRYYARAARSERTATRMPSIIEKAEAECDRLSSMLRSAYAGETGAEDIRSVLPAAPARQRRGAQAPAPPYRSYRSSGGLEIRVGRGARHNDDLTFRHSAPDDIWLHARHTAGAHVILRWSTTDAPPARDLEEAGILAALHSKARTSSSVPIDWTRRKYVRKPRGSAPGSVVPDRVKTVFVHPDETMLETLAEDG